MIKKIEVPIEHEAFLFPDMDPAEQAPEGDLSAAVDSASTHVGAHKDRAIVDRTGEKIENSEDN